jgi:hypothetical protein
MIRADAMLFQPKATTDIAALLLVDVGVGVLRVEMSRVVMG